MSTGRITVVVNDYDRSGASEDAATLVAPITYVALGAAPAAADSPAAALRGDELVEGLAFKDDLRGAVAPGQAVHRADGASSTSSASDATSRAALSAELLVRGGWREHTDGNRISTTRGDCVEVVYGNYKLVVLGRVAGDGAFDPSANAGLGDAATSVDISGGLITETTETQGRVVSCTWQTDGDGSWATVEQTDAGDKRVVFTGRHQRHVFGSSVTRRVGYATDALVVDSGETTLAGHAAERPEVTRTTFARSVRHRERASKTERWLTADGDVSVSTHVHERYVRAGKGGTWGELVATCAIREELMADAVHERVEFSTARVRADVGAAQAEVATVGYHETLYSGSRTSLWLGGVDMSVTSPVTTSLKIGMDSAYRLGVSIDKIDGAMVRLHATVDLMAHLSSLVNRLFANKNSLADGEVVILASSNAAFSSTV